MTLDDRSHMILLPPHVAHIKSSNPCVSCAIALHLMAPSRGKCNPEGARRPHPCAYLLGTARARLMLAPNPSPVFRLAPLVVVSRHAGCATAAPRGTTGYTQRCLEGPVRAGLQLGSTHQTNARLDLSPLVVPFWSGREAPHDHWAPVAS